MYPTARKSKITKIPNSEENSKRKVRNQMTKAKAKTHQTNGYQLLVHTFSFVEKHIDL